jgi:hypothetical protein
MLVNSRTELFNNRFGWIAAVDWRWREQSRGNLSLAERHRVARRKAVVQAALRRLVRNFADLFPAT